MPDALSPKLQRRLPVALAVLRGTLGIFLLLWALEKIVAPAGTTQIFASFYGVEISTDLAPWIGGAELVLVAAFLAGLWRRLTYGLATLFHAVSVASTWQQLLDPIGPPNHLFIAGVPVLAGFVVLYLLRDWDHWTVDGVRERRRPSTVTRG